MHRLFAALPVPEELGDRLIALQDEVAGARWRPEENFHITLHFFGEVQTPLAREIDAEIGEIAAPQLELELSGAGWFGRREPRALFARVRPDPALSKLAKACRNVARRFGLALDSHPFLPHVTLAYCNDTPLEEAMAWSERWQEFRSGPFWADRFHLYESHERRGQPSLYEPVADYPLSG